MKSKHYTKNLRNYEDWTAVSCQISYAHVQPKISERIRRKENLQLASKTKQENKKNLNWMKTKPNPLIS